MTAKNESRVPSLTETKGEIADADLDHVSGGMFVNLAQMEHETLKVILNNLRG